jgi:hypothetical protein
VYPVLVARELDPAKQWLRIQARGSERFGLVCSCQALRLRPHAIDVRAPVDPVHWFLDGKDDVRSSVYLEDVATEFQAQGLELDWAGVVWDADLRIRSRRREHWSFAGDRWQRIKKPERQTHLLNAFQVWLTRARQEMAIVVPHGDPQDSTRAPELYDGTCNYLRWAGFKEPGGAQATPRHDMAHPSSCRWNTNPACSRSAWNPIIGQLLSIARSSGAYSTSTAGAPTAS